MLEVGFSQVTITPPLGTPLGGYENRKFHALGIHDDLRARCMLFKDTGTGVHVAVIVCDLLWVNYQFTDGVKAIIEEITRGAVKKDNIIIPAIHTHSSQRLEGGLDFYYKPIKKKNDIDQGWYLEHGIPYLQRVIASGVYGALQNLKPATILCNVGTTDTGHNRRYGDEAAKVVDKELFAMAFLEGEGHLDGSNIRAVFYSLANHCVALGGENYFISADWPYFAAKVLEKALQLEWKAPVIFGQGASGNTNPYNCRFGQEEREIRDAENVGNQVAADVITTLREDRLKSVATKGEPCSI
nr:neutral/alkaline non-lysosomal ceramidase N-terminal domain-containing protein [Candidatus Sigynarchaeota archaeon]